MGEIHSFKIAVLKGGLSKIGIDETAVEQIGTVKNGIASFASIEIDVDEVGTFELGSIEADSCGQHAHHAAAVPYRLGCPYIIQLAHEETGAFQAGPLKVGSGESAIPELSVG